MNSLAVVTPSDGRAQRRARLWGAVEPAPVVAVPQGPKFFETFRTPIDFYNLSGSALLIKLVCLKYGVSFGEFTSEHRSKAMCVARDEACYLMRSHTAMSLNAIGRRVRRHHSTVIHSLRNYSKRAGATQ